jgi:alpha-tubulin suppressor-like RCC1 family protein
MSSLRYSATLAVLLLAGCNGEPTSPGREPRFSSVVAGAESTCALTTGGEAYCWGDNRFGQVGLGYADTVPVEVPQKVAGGMRFRSIHAAGIKTCAVDLDGTLYCWGQFEEGAIRGPTSMFLEVRFASVARHSTDFTCGVLTQGSSVCWGTNRSGITSSPTGLYTVPGTEPFREVSVGGYTLGEGTSRDPAVRVGHACGVTTTAEGYCWGDNARGQLGVADTTRVAARPLRVAGNLSFRTIQAGAVNTCGLDVSGALFCWGQGVRTPQSMAAGLRFEALDVGSAHACALTADGQVYCWGENTLAARPEPVVGRTRFRSVSASKSWYHYRVGAGVPGHTCAVGRDEAIYCWGSNRRGQLGRPGRASSSEPLRTN